ncbi:hypothetical protein AU193_10715 [Mycobacterium sp. GA-1285]|uniref:hypothetical protein n=1 Tax=Mycobacterium sp. GA-1285 TaxID=1772282 RepID=UPI00074610A9|nr:hypothetical protein [Mycobacterium sp. GA-1285]KUI22761.1 hypothetical protein AU193_10715 [Mycobacterium sp. GA-1285]
MSLDDAIRLIGLCEFDLELQIVERDDSDLAHAARIAPLTGQQRLDRRARLATCRFGRRELGDTLTYAAMRCPPRSMV